jgi:hypothetical protein
VGPIALKFAEQSARRAALREQAADENLVGHALSGARIRTIGKVVPLAPVAEGDASPAREDSEGAKTIEPEPIQHDFPLQQADEVSARAVAVLASTQPSWITGQDHGTDSSVRPGLIGKTLIGKTRAWFRHAAMARRQPLD